MNDFLQDYREVNRFLFLENYRLKNNQQLIFLTLPPVESYYPNQSRIFCCEETIRKRKQNRKKEKLFTFDIEVPTKERNMFRIFGHSPIFHDDPDYIKDIGEEKTSVTVTWLDYDGETNNDEEEVEGEGEESIEDEAAGRMKKKKKKSKLEGEKVEQELDYADPSQVDKSARIIQKYIRRMKARGVMKHLRKRSYKRMNVCRELVKTEKDYVNNLKVLKSVYIDPFKELSQAKSRGVISPQDFGQVFAGLESIIKLNEGLAVCLERCIFDQCGDYDAFALISKEILAIAPFIMMYRTYCAKYERTLDRLKQLRGEKKFSDVLEKMDKDAKTTKLGLPSYLILPIQRVPRYKLLLRDIIRCTEELHPDRKGLEEAYTKIEETADLLNKAMKEIEESEKVLKLSKRFVMGSKKFVIHQPHRRFVREGTLYRGKNKKNPRHVHLFNDVFVISVRNQRNGMFEFRNVVEMKNLGIRFSNDVGNKTCIKLGPDQTFYCRSVEDRDRWLKSIYTCRNEYHMHRGAEQVGTGIVRSNTKSVSFGGGITGLEVAEEEFQLTVDHCIALCKDASHPTIMLKAVSKTSIFKKNKPHQRKFVISADEKKVQWGSPKKKLSESGITISSIKELVLGQTTINFRRAPIPSAAGLSFSLLYGDGGFEKNGDWNGRTLDLIALNRRDFNIWTRALKFLIQDKGRTAHTRRGKGKKYLGGEKGGQTPGGGRGGAEPSLADSLMLNSNEEKVKFEKSYMAMGDIYTWGRGEHGALGHGSEKSEKLPKVVMILLPYDVKDVFCGKRCCSSVLTNGNVLAWGHNENCRLGHTQEANFLTPQPVVKLGEKKVKYVSHGDMITLFLTEDGSVYGCGDNSEGFLSQEVKEKKVAEPTLIMSSNLGFRKIVYIEAGSHHFGCIDDHGRLYTWGKGDFGQLGHGEKEDVSVPKIVESLQGVRVKQVALGNWHSMVLTDDGKVYSFGDGSFGQLGRKPETNNSSDKKLESTTPELIPFFSDFYKQKEEGKEEEESYLRITSISTGQSHSGAIDAVGNCYLWGAGNYGQLGNGHARRVNHEPVLVRHFISSSKSIIKMHEKSKNNNSKEEVINKYRFLQLSCGANHCIALLEEVVQNNNNMEHQHQNNKRFVTTWGAGTYGRLGFKSEKDVYIPTELPFFTKNKIVRKVYAKGQISATVNAHQWIPDSDAPRCMKCEKNFTFTRRRHHCRNCGGIFCGKDSSRRIMILQFGFDQDVRVCDNCYNILKKKYKK